MRTTPWTLDRTINLPFLVTVAALIASLAAFASKTDARLQNLETQTKGLSDMSAKVAVMYERSDNLQRELARLSPPSVQVQ